MKEKTFFREKGVAMVIVTLFTFILLVLGAAFLRLATHERISADKSVQLAQAFYLAEAGIGKILARYNAGLEGDIPETELGEGTYHVNVYAEPDISYAISTGKVGNVEKSVKVEMSFLAVPLEYAMFGGGIGGAGWILELRGTGSPVGTGGYTEQGGRDIVNGDIYANGDVELYGESEANPAPAPNTYNLSGDINATGTIDLHESSSVDGDQNEYCEEENPPDLVGMDYANNNTHNLSQIFDDAGVSSGTLPSGHELRNIFTVNPSNRSSECASTTGDDYFLEPTSGIVAGTPKTAQTPVNIGDDRIYYIDGNLWVHNYYTYGFKVNGRASIIVTGDIHICDNIGYESSDDILGLVALGSYDSGGNLVSGGDIYFGDPVYGTMYTVSSLMFAADDFLYNTDSNTGEPEEPETGFEIYGSMMALDQISIMRDWYDQTTITTETVCRWVGGRRVCSDEQVETTEPHPAYYDSSTSEWKDLDTDVVLTFDEIASLRHYQMKVTYDERVRDENARPDGLPRGGGKVIFAGIVSWEELPAVWE